jgi:hypothetical protein
VSGGRRKADLSALPPFKNSGDENHESGCGKRRGDEFQMAEELFNLSLLCSAKESFLNNLLEQLSEDPGQKSGPDQEDGESLEGSTAREVGQLPKLRMES